MDVKSISATELESLAKKFLDENNCKVLVVSMGAKGALLATANTIEHIPAPAVHQQSTIGAGDSMVAGMVLSLIQGRPLSEMVQYGVACGTAATIHPGTQLCSKKDADELFEWVKANSVKKNKKKSRLI